MERTIWHRTAKARNLFNLHHEAVGQVIFAIACLTAFVVVTVQALLLDFPTAPTIVGAWMWWLLIPFFGGLILSEMDEI